jgi:HEPN domain-containing protein
MEKSSIRPREVVQRELVDEWLAKAEEDLDGARALFAQRRGLLGLVGYHAQQAAEKFLKAFLTHHQIEFPKTHEIEELLKLTAQVDPGMVPALKEADALTDYGVDARYPGGPVPANRNEAQEAIDLAERVREYVLGSLPRTS